MGVVVVLAGCTAKAVSVDPVTATTPAAKTSPANPVGLVAIGHSALTGGNSDPNLPGQDAFANSWATGTNPAIDSIYQRMIAQWPDTQGRVVNAAVGGATADSLAAQADAALHRIPVPRLVIIQTIDNDIKCDGNDADYVSAFGKSVDAALQLITRRSPKSRILIVTQPGRPATDIAAGTEGGARAAFVAHWTGPAPCGFYNNKGQLQPKNVATLTSIIEGYEAEQARVCAKYPTCSTDKGALHSFVSAPSYMSPDLNHMNITGLAALAKAVWPFVQAALQ